MSRRSLCISTSVVQGKKVKHILGKGISVFQTDLVTYLNVGYVLRRSRNEVHSIAAISHTLAATFHSAPESEVKHSAL